MLLLSNTLYKVVLYKHMTPGIRYFNFLSHWTSTKWSHEIPFRSDGYFMENNREYVENIILLIFISVSSFFPWNYAIKSQITVSFKIGMKYHSAYQGNFLNTVKYLGSILLNPFNDTCLSISNIIQIWYKIESE
jgi:hypothetical protein